MKRLILSCILLLSLVAASYSEVVNPAPNFTWPKSGSGVTSLKDLRGQPVVLVVAPSPRSRAFKAQASRIEEMYDELAARNVVFIAAFTQENEVRVPSDIPWIVVPEGANIAALYGVKKFSVVVIGEDGNVDFQSGRVQAVRTIKDIVVNSFEVQKDNRE